MLNTLKLDSRYVIESIAGGEDFLPFSECLREIAKWRVRKLSLTLSIYPERLVYKVAFSFFSRGIRSLRNDERVAREPH